MRTLCKRTWIVLAMLTLLLASPLGARAQKDLTVLQPQADTPSPRKMWYNYLLGQAKIHFDARRAAVAALKTPADVHKRQDLLKAKFIEALGGFPEKAPLDARVVGTLKGDGYRVEKVIYESRPQHHVTASLYLPEGKGPFPDVLMPIGHSSNGKAADYIQRGSILLAKNGLAVLTYDPIGQGERRQLLDRQGKPAINSATSEHTLVGVGALLVGQSTATYRIWDGMRSLDYLAGRPEIDAKRLGCTGCSGGGTDTSYLMALDDRIACAAPSCYITSLERLFATLGPQDAEQNITGQVAFGMEHADYLTLRAPRPTLLCAASRDFFDIQGTWTTFREATLLYGLLGHSERVALVEYNTTHGFPRPQREAVARWMRRWLLDRDDSPVESAVSIAADKDLQCTRSSQVLEDFKGKSVFHLNAERADELARVRNQATRGRDELLKDMRLLIGLPDAIKAATLSRSGKGHVALAAEIQRDGYTIRKWTFETEPGILVPALHFLPTKAVKDQPLVLYVHGRGKAVDAGVGGAMEKLLRAGNQVLALDLRGTGETAPGVSGQKPSLFGTDFKEAFVSLHLNRPALGQRVFDLLAVVEYLAGDPIFAKAPLHLVGVESAAPVALHAAALEPRIRQVTLERPILSWSAVVRSPISYDQLTNVVPGALKVYDLPDLAALVAPRPLTVSSPLSPLQEPVPQALLDQTYAGCRRAYEGQKVGDRLTLRSGD